MSNRNQVLRDAAILRNRVESCLKGSTSPMRLAEIWAWPSVQEIAPGTRGYARVLGQVSNLVKLGTVEKIGESRSNTTYVWHKQAATVLGRAASLDLQIDREARSIRFVFEGVEITVKILS